MEKTITIAGQEFTVTSPYEAGHTLTEGEANALNQTRHENIRNNMAKLVKENPDKLDQAALQAKITEYDAAYEFGVRAAGPGISRDPVLTEARSIARAAIKAALKREGKTADADWISAKVEELVTNRTDIVELARKRVADKQAIAEDLLTAA